MAKFNIGDKVRILDVDAIMFGEDYWNDGDVTEVVGHAWGEGDGVRLRILKGEYAGETFPVTKDEFHAIEKVGDGPSSDIEELKRRVSVLEAQVNRLKTNKMVDELTQRTRPNTISANECRAEVIEKAKKFVEEVTAITGNGFSEERHRRGFYNANYITDAEFIINEEKRTVVALGKGVGSRRILYKGIAKCAPSDVFNVHIGKAIALGRAYGLDVSEFEQAPQPDEVVPGMVVERYGTDGTFINKVTVKRVSKLRKGTYRHAPESTHELNGFYLYGGCGDRIISDSEAQY